MESTNKNSQSPGVQLDYFTRELEQMLSPKCKLCSNVIIRTSCTGLALVSRGPDTIFLQGVTVYREILTKGKFDESWPNRHTKTI